MSMSLTKSFLGRRGFPEGDLHQLPDSPKRFSDGAHYRVEIPSVESPQALQTVVEEMERRQITVHRVSQGSGIMLLTDAEIMEMASIGRQNGIEVSLFLGPRAPFDIQAQSFTAGGKSIGLRAAGMDQLLYSVEEVKRACQLGIRGVLVADEGVLWTINEMKKAGELPSDLVVKVSVSMGACNPVSVRIMQDLGADTYNLPSDMTLARLAALRQAVDIPLDLYIESPDDFGGFVRYYELCEIIRVAAPVYIKFGLRNAPNVYPAGTHLEETVVRLTREKVRRAKLGLDMIQRYSPHLLMSSSPAPGAGIPKGGVSDDE
ncbi:U32 family peptidase [Paenibacillus senegalensis]|uniref:U32 family peptidase n=1 Tax=Paenibacillus senegalensis TaxID=1465766 RepID=UPI0002897E24|nr:U32 family peptidase [Paenibacillus senegalensis]